MASDAYDVPLSATAIPGAIVVQMPMGGGDATLTVEAALISAARLTEAARLALFGDLPPLETDE